MADELDPADLAAQRCMPVDASTPRLPPGEAQRLATGLDPAWRLEPDRLVREFRFRPGSFGAAFALATRIALLAETHGHHPRLEVTWGRLIVTWTTDAIGGLTVNDAIMAARVDRLVARGLGLAERP